MYVTATQGASSQMVVTMQPITDNGITMLCSVQPYVERLETVKVTSHTKVEVQASQCPLALDLADATITSLCSSYWQHVSLMEPL